MIEPLLQAERLLLHGLVDQAEDLYRRTLDADPRNAIAITGLARVAIERGDDMVAYQHACQALEIDPQNPAALRLEARLSEILVTRGEVVERPAWLRTSRPASTSADEPRPTEPTAEQPAEQRAEPRESEQAVFARNPSMADHAEREAAGEPAREPVRDEPRTRPQPKRRRGLIRRLLGL